MAEKRGENILKWEEPGKYTIMVDKAKNLLSMEFVGVLKKAEDLPNYLKHTEEAVAAVTDNYFLIGIPKTESAPGFGLTGLFKKSHKIMQTKKMKKVAAVVTKPVYKMVLNVVLRLSGTEAKIFPDMESAEKWLFEEE